jgi:hypothetical protein
MPNLRLEDFHNAVPRASQFEPPTSPAPGEYLEAFVGIDVAKLRNARRGSGW